MPGVKFSSFVDGGAPQAGDEVAGLRNGINTLFDFSTFNGFTLSREFNQVAHGLVLGQVVRFDGINFVLAQANLPANADVVGIVAAVIDANNFILQFGGFVQNLIPLLIPGTVYFLSDIVAGGMTAVNPVVVGEVRKPLLISYSTTTGFWLNYQGQVL